jgi:CheY-like chemotaxis protein/nitrogen-specific signal transduction histidine kinase
MDAFRSDWRVLVVLIPVPIALLALVAFGAGTWPGQPTLLIAGVVCAASFLGLLITLLRLDEPLYLAYSLVCGLLGALLIARSLGGPVSFPFGLPATTTDWGLQLTLGLAILAVVAAAPLVLFRTEGADRFATVADQLREAVMIVRPDGSLRGANQHAAGILSWRDERLSILETVLTEDRDLLWNHLKHPAASHRQEFRVRESGGAVRRVESVLNRLPWGESLVAWRDITSRRALESRLLDGARFETHETITAGIAHDLNNALAGVLAQVAVLEAEAAADRSAGGPTGRGGGEALIQLKRATLGLAKRSRNLVSMLRDPDVGEPETAGTRQVFDLHEVVDRALDLIRPTLSPGITLSFSGCSAAAETRGPRARTEQAVISLLAVVAENLHAPAELHLELGGQPAEAAGGEPSGRPRTPSPQDPGPEQLRLQIRTSRDLDVSGEPPGLDPLSLALAGVRQLLRRSEIEVELHSGPETGFLISLVFPAVPVSPPPRSPAMGWRSHHVVVVEDESAIREGLVAILRRAGYETTAYGDAESARSALSAADAPRVHLLLTDVVLPGESGIELARHLGEILPDLAVLVVSGFVPREVGVLMPHWYSLAKPFSAEAVLAAVGAAITAPEQAGGQE